MIQVCIMSWHEGYLASDKKVYLSLMGGCGLIGPTLARQIVTKRERERNGSARPPRQFFLTIMGAAEITAPPLAQEFLDLRDLLSSGAISMTDWDRAGGDAGHADVSIGSLTLMGHFSDRELPSEDDEINALALQRHLGHITEAQGQVLQCGIGQRGAERRATVRRAVTVGGTTA